MAAVLACGPGAVLSHLSAAVLHGLLGNPGGYIDVTVPTRSTRRHPRVRIRRSMTLTDGDVTVVDGIPCTTAARTMLDISDILRRRSVERAFDQMEILEAFDLRAINDQLGLPDPEVNQWLVLADSGPSIQADFLWRAQRVVVETDGHKFHGTRQAFERDRNRDQRLTVANWRPIRTTWRQVFNRPGELRPRLIRLVNGTPGAPG